MRSKFKHLRYFLIRKNSHHWSRNKFQTNLNAIIISSFHPRFVLMNVKSHVLKYRQTFPPFEFDLPFAVAKKKTKTQKIQSKFPRPPQSHIIFQCQRLKAKKSRIEKKAKEPKVSRDCRVSAAFNQKSLLRATLESIIAKHDQKHRQRRHNKRTISPIPFFLSNSLSRLSFKTREKLERKRRKEREREAWDLEYER